MAALAEHPLRYELVNELHARPSPRIQVPSTCVFLALKNPGDGAARDRGLDYDHLLDLTNRHGGARPDPTESHYQGTLGRHQLKWESHTEFVTYMATTPGLPIRPFDPSAAAIFSDSWQKAAPGKRVAGVMVQVDVLPEDSQETRSRIAAWFEPESLALVWVLEEDALIAGDFRIDEAGWMRFVVFVRPGVGPGRVGRIVHRLVELETYRAMSMLGMRRVRDLTQRLNGLEPRLSQIVAHMDNEDLQAEKLLHELLAVSAELEAQAAQMSFRFGASKAYEAIVMDRVTALRESRFLQGQMLSEFMRRRYQPAMRTVHSAEQRLNTVLERAARAAELLRTRVDVERSAQNQELMTRMDRRADLQLRLQHTVEGLSVFAISYYAVGLLSYALYPLADALHLEKPYLIAAATPVVLALVWWSMRRIKQRIHRSDHD